MNRRARRPSPRAAGQQSNFTGGTPSQLDAKAIRTLHLEFPAGSRSNWHLHTSGRLLRLAAV